MIGKPHGYKQYGGMKINIGLREIYFRECVLVIRLLAITIFVMIVHSEARNNIKNIQKIKYTQHILKTKKISTSY